MRVTPRVSTRRGARVAPIVADASSPSNAFCCSPATRARAASCASLALVRLVDLARDLLEAREVHLAGELQQPDVALGELVAVVVEEVVGELDVVARRARWRCS